jgi:D-lactate dehydrogenase (cytochrome)
MREMEARMRTEINELVGELESILGAEHVSTDADDLELFAFDFSEQQLERPAAIARPGSTEEVAAIVRIAHRSGIPMVPRGGGMSYTLGYLPSRPGTLAIDMRRMNAIEEVNTEDMYCIVQTGVTWKQLHDEFSDLDFRIPFMGTLSGKVATVGGGLANNATGVGKGFITDDLLGIEVVLPDGRVLQTGSRAYSEPEPTTRHFGPDLTGLFIHDNGAFGIKTRATFHLARKPRGTAYASFGFQSDAAAVHAVVDIGRSNLASEIQTLGRYHNREFALAMKPAPDEARSMIGKVMRMSSTRRRGLWNIFQLIRSGGLRFLEKWERTLHVVVDGFDQVTADRAMREVRRIARVHGGKSIAPPIAIAMRAEPFHPIERLMVGSQAQCSFPSNCSVPVSRADSLVAGLDRFLEEQAPFMEQHGLEVARLYLYVPDLFGCEPIIYWKDRLNPLRLSVVSPERRAELAAIPENREAREAALELRRRLVEFSRQFAGIHLQIGKFYPYEDKLINPTSWELIQSLKKSLDPEGLMNSGVLGLDNH